MLSYRSTGVHYFCQMLNMTVILDFFFSFFLPHSHHLFIYFHSFSHFVLGIRAASPGTEILSAVISTINGHNKVALKLCRAQAVLAGRLLPPAATEGKAAEFRFLPLFISCGSKDVWTNYSCLCVSSTFLTTSHLSFTSLRH